MEILCLLPAAEREGNSGACRPVVLGLQDPLPSWQGECDRQHLEREAGRLVDPESYQKRSISPIGPASWKKG
jgi:hypothetical protein